MHKANWFAPETVEEVAKAEADIADAKTDRPTSFQNPLELLKQELRLNYVNCVSPKEDDEVTDGLARAARAGGVISPEVEERMRRDRDIAESK
jgi:hypothetical protein